jgi:hypothetical protein
VVLVLASVAACSAAPAADPTPSSTPQPSSSLAPSETPKPAPTIAGTLTVADGMVVDGPGTPLADALAGDLTQPVLVRGALFLDTDGKVYLADAVTDQAAPEFGDLRVAVDNYPTDGPTWDMANASDIGLQEANGIRFFADTKLYGTISD